MDAIYHCVRAFTAKKVEHVDGEVDPIRDLETISSKNLILTFYSRRGDFFCVQLDNLFSHMDFCNKQFHKKYFLVHATGGGKGSWTTLQR